MELQDLEAHLRALRQEEEDIENRLSGFHETDGVRSSSVGVDQAGSRQTEDGQQAAGNSYSSFATPPAGDVRGRKRAVFIRRSAAVGSLVLGVMLAVTFVSQTDEMEREDALLDGVGSVPATLHAVGKSLSKHEKTTIELREQAAEQLNRWHKKWETERAGHLVKLIHEKAELKEKRQEERKHEEMAITEHRQKLAQKRAERAELIAADEHKTAGGANQLENSQFREEDLAQEHHFEASLKHTAADDKQSFLQRQHASEVKAREVQTARQAHDEEEAAARKRYRAARAAVVLAKDKLRDALVHRDQEEEAIHSNDFLTSVEEKAKMKPVHEKIEALLKQTEAAKKEWEEAHTALEQVEQQGLTRSSLLSAVPEKQDGKKESSDERKEEAKRRLAAKADRGKP